MAENPDAFHNIRWRWVGQCQDSILTCGVWKGVDEFSKRFIAFRGFVAVTGYTWNCGAGSDWSRANDLER